jgi:hypothetical protein
MEMDGLICSAPACYGSSLGVIRIQTKIQNGLHKQRSGQHDLARQKIKLKKLKKVVM